MANETNQSNILQATASGAFSLEPYLDYLKEFSAPTETFDPEGSWEHTYDVYPVYGKWSKWAEKHRGQFRIKREALAREGTFQLDVSSEVTFIDFGYGNHPTKSQLTTASIRCANNVLATPQSWELESVALGEERKPRALSKISESGVLVDGAIELTSPQGENRRIVVSQNMTSNWSLLDAVQRMYRKKPPETDFVMLEDLRLLRANQRLTSDGPIEIELRGKMTRLYGFHQTGEGILPIHYWLDEQGRVLFALGGVRVYLWQST